MPSVVVVGTNGEMKEKVKLQISSAQMRKLSLDTRAVIMQVTPS